MDTDVDQHLRDVQREYLDFLDDAETEGTYTDKVREMVTNNDFRLIVNINELRKKNETRANALLSAGCEELVCFQKALKEFVATADTAYAKQHEEFFVGFEGSFGAKHVTPRSLTSSYLGNLVCVEGIVTKCSLVRTKVVRSVHYCPATKKTIERRYTDLTSLDAFPSSAVYPTKDEDNNPLETEFGLSAYKDHQTFTIQEMPEKAPAGQLPRSVDIVADDDLVDACKPGDRVQVIGLYRCLPSKKGGFTSGTFRTIMIANNVKLMSKEVAPSFSADDVAKIKKFSKSKKDVFEILAKSMAPTIHGHEYIKKAVLCMLLGGCEKVLTNGTRLRGDINVLLIGDPSTAKSQMLRYVLHTAPRAIPTTGRGSSGVGLTAAVTTDQETGERRLEAGAMVLADRGVVCIDEFDKMTDMDRTAIHEVMEQGRVTIAKAGIHAKLNARCSVLAAANPVYGRYDQYKTPMDNIGMQDSLLSRFDLLFIVLDKMDPEHDRMISDHVLRIHRYRSPGEQDGDVLPMGSDVDVLTTADLDAAEEEEKEMSIYEKHDNTLHGQKKDKKEKIVSMQFMRKYIHVAKALRPALTREASDCIADEYSKLRSQENLASDVARTQPVTARSLETMIRLASAHAKARMSKTITREDAEAAIEMVQFAIFHKVLEKAKKKRQREADSEDEEEEDEEQPAKRRKERPPRNPDDPYDYYDDEDETVPDIGHRREKSKEPKEKESDESMDVSATSGAAAKDGVSADRLQMFQKSLLGIFKKEHAESLPLKRVTEAVNGDHPDDPFSEIEIRSAVDKMMDNNQVMLSDETIFLI
ncbi:MCM3 [Branchiostoma lanceolatum]|uniref:DNA replication licensing factor MCM3 n=1 Tax=Branchiostoma lanceolatum TaxID=7740 RepID=A0A8J9Z6J0_BRALA|nr:MCM3 [Branchiostoma lanceolatum]